MATPCDTRARARHRSAAMRNLGVTVLLLSLSNVFMTFAWLKELRGRPWIVAALVSWGMSRMADSGIVGRCV